MKKFIVCLTLVITLAGYSRVQAQFKDPVAAWGVSLGGAQGDIAPGDKWVMQYRGYFQYEFVPALLGQIGVGYANLKAPSYGAEVLMADLRLLVVPFSLPNLNPFIYGGLGLSKTLNINNSNFLPIVPFGIGIQTRVAPGLLLQISGGYDLSLSDKLAPVPVTNNSLTNNKDDGFFVFSIGLAFGASNGISAEEQAAEARHIQDSTNAAAEAARVQAANAAEAQRVKDSTNAASVAEAARIQAANAAEAQRVKDSTNAASAAEAARVQAANVAEAQRVKDSTNAAALRLAQQKSSDTLIVLIKGKAVVLRGVNFEFNKATLTKDSERILWRAYNAMVANPNVRVVITGHTDNVGNQKSNQVLSLKRAQAVKNWLVKKGIASNRMRTVGRGENEPMSSNKTEEGRAENRRIEFYVQ